MGEWYDFEIRIIDGREVSGFAYSNERTGWNEVFVEMTSEQKSYATNYHYKCVALQDEMKSTVKNWIDGENESK